jgi:hypothetical protein
VSASDPIPPPPAWVPRLAAGIREEWPYLVGGLLLIGSSLVGLGVLGLLPATGLSGFAGSFLAVYAVLLLLQSPHSGLLGERFKRRVQDAIVSSGVGFYGVVTLSRFLQLELHDVLAALREFELSRAQVQGLLRDWLIGFSMQSLMNSIEAMLWPFKMISAHGMAKAAIVFVPLWALYRLGGWVFPELAAQIEAEDGEPPAAGDGAVGPPPPPR